MLPKLLLHLVRHPNRCKDVSVRLCLRLDVIIVSSALWHSLMKTHYIVEDGLEAAQEFFPFTQIAQLGSERLHIRIGDIRTIGGPKLNRSPFFLLNQLQDIGLFSISLWRPREA